MHGRKRMLGALVLRTLLRNQRGQSITQVLIAVAIMGVVMAAFTSLIAIQMKESKALAEKLAALDLQQFLTASLADGSVCAYVLNNPTVLTFDSTKPLPQTITLPDPDAKGERATLFASILPGPPAAPGPAVARVGSIASVASNSLIVQSIQLQITQGSAGSYAGNWLVSFDSSKTVRSIRPAAVAVKLTADITTPTSAKITSCQSGSASGNPAGSPCSVTTAQGTWNGVTATEPTGKKCCMVSNNWVGSYSTWGAAVCVEF